MSLKNCLMLILVLTLIFSILPLNAAAQETGETTEPTAAAQAPAEKEEGIPWGFTALILALITTILQRIFIFNRR